MGGRFMSLVTLARRRPAPEYAPEASPWVPAPGPSDYAPPRSSIDPDPTKSWLRRALPIVLAHRRMFGTALVMSFVGLVLQVEIPQLLGSKALDSALVPFVQQSSLPAGPAAAGLALPAHPVPLRRHRAGPGRCGRDVRLRLPTAPDEDGVSDRVRPAQHHVRPPEPDVVRLLRPGAVRAADLAGQLRHPLGADVPDVRPVDPRAVPGGRGGLRLHAVRSTCSWPWWPCRPCR